MRMEPEAFLALMDAPDAAQTEGNALGDTWVGYHPIAGVFLGFHEDMPIWSAITNAVATRVTVFTEPEFGVAYLEGALATYGCDAELLEMHQVADGNWPSLLAIGLPVAQHQFDAVARMALTHRSTESMQ